MPDVWAATWEFSGAFGAWTKILPGFLPHRGKKARSDPASAVQHAIHGLARWSGRSRTSAGSSQDLGIEATHWSHPEHSSGDVFMPRPSIQKRLLGKQESGEATHSKTLHQAWAGIMNSPSGNQQGNSGVLIRYPNYLLSTSDLQKTRRTCGIGLRSEWLPRIHGRYSAFVVPLCMSKCMSMFFTANKKNAMQCR